LAVLFLQEQREPMPTIEDAMFRRLSSDQDSAVEMFVDERPVIAQVGDSVAAALLAAGIGTCRTTPITGAPRAPYCMMGVCFDCLVTVDGLGSQQACLARVRQGMRVETQQGRRDPRR
jgi:D-hydroxyproline dehydrogenase subunit gamma